MRTVRHILPSFIAFAGVATYILVASTVYAADPQPLNTQLQPSGLVGITADQAKIEKTTDPVGALTKIVNWLLSLVAILATIAIIWGGIMYILALGNESRASLAKRIIGYALFGLVIVILSYAIIATVRSALG